MLTPDWTTTIVAIVTFVFGCVLGFRRGRQLGEVSEYARMADAFAEAQEKAITSKRAPERIPDVSLMNFPLLSEKRSVVLREREHGSLSAARRCHAYKGLEYHYCGRDSGRVFPLAPDIVISTQIKEGGAAK
jgi:hypothetical protein